jgi:excisionase family DNA binding protein
MKVVTKSDEAPPVLLTVAETARAWRVKPATLRMWIFHERVPVVRLGSRVLVHRETVERVQREGLSRATA